MAKRKAPGANYARLGERRISSVAARRSWPAKVNWKRLLPRAVRGALQKLSRRHGA